MTTQNGTNGAGTQQPGQQPGAFGANPQWQQPQMDPEMRDAMMRSMFPEIYGEPVRESAYEDAVFAGTIRKGTDLEIGVFSVMVLKPDAQHPKAEMAVRSNGTITTDPARLRKIGDAFIAWSKDAALKEAHELAQGGEEKAQQEALTLGMTKGALS